MAEFFGVLAIFIAIGLVADAFIRDRRRTRKWRDKRPPFITKD